MKKLQEEVDHLGTLGDKLERTHLKDARYLQNVMKESWFPVYFPLKYMGRILTSLA